MSSINTNATCDDELTRNYKQKLNNRCRGKVSRVEVDVLGALTIRGFSLFPDDLDVIDDLLDVESVERSGPFMEVSTKKQVAPCGQR